MATYNSFTRRGPLNEEGAEEGMTCSPGVIQTVTCAVDDVDDPSITPTRPFLSAITVRTFMQDGTTTTQTSKAPTNKMSVHKKFPSDALSRDYTCEIGELHGVAPPAVSPPVGPITP